LGGNIVLRYVLAGSLSLSAAVAVSSQPAQAAQPAHAVVCHPVLRGVALAHSSIPGGASDTARVTLSCAAPTAVVVRLHGFTGVTVPAAVSVARGKNSATGTVRSAVSKVTRHGSVVAVLGTVRRSAALTVTKTPPSCKSPVLTGMSLASKAYVGDHPVATIDLSCAPLAPIRLALSSTSTNVPVPATVTVGRYYDYAQVTLVPKAYEPGQYAATIKVRRGGRSLSRTIVVDPGLQLVQIPPVSDAPDDVTLNVVFTGEIPEGGETVKLASSNAAVTVPAAYSFPAPSFGGEVTGITVRQVTKNTKVTLSATLGGVIMSASTVLLPPFNSHDNATIVNANGSGPIYGLNGATYDYAVLLSNPAPAGGLTFNVASGSPDLVVTNPQSIAPGFTADFFAVDTTLVTAPVRTTLSTTVDGVSASVKVTIEPPMSSFAVPATVTGGQSFSVTLNMFGPVDTPTVVNLSSSSGVLSTPLSVTVPAGKSSVSFTVSTATVTSPDTDFILGTIVSNSQVLDSLQSSTITVNP
jgi:hypothetical protein